MKKLLFLFGFLFFTNILIFSQTWNPQNSGTPRTLLAVSFIDANNGLATGNNSTILKTTTGGQIWFSQTFPTYPEPLNVKFINSYFATIVGQGGQIFRTSDGGNNWFSQTSGTSQPLRGIDFVDTNNGWVVGEQGVILKTTNGGSTWISQNSGITSTLWSVDFTDVNNGTAVGGVFGAARILRTTDGGQNWAQQTHTSQYAFYGVSFPSTLVGYAVSDFGIIMKTTNGGLNWIALVSPVSGSFRNVSFSNEYNGIIVDLGGYIIRTTNAGQNWLQDNSGTTQPLFGICMFNSDLAWAVGGNGVILKYGSGTIAPSITVTAPNGGENVTVGSTQNITWTSSNVSNVMIEYTTNNGSNWFSFGSSYPASSGSFSIIVPNTPSTQCKVKVSDVSNSSISDMSDNVFTISTGTTTGGLIAYYPFNGNANDESGNGKNGVVYGATLTTDRFGNPNSAYNFDGTSNFIDIPGTNNLNLNVGGLSLAAWINFTEQNNIHAIVGKHIAGYGNGYILQIRPATKGEFFVDSEYGLQFSESLNDGNWHFLVGTFDGSTMKFYVDGMQKVSQSKTYTNINDSTLMIGKHHAGAATNFFNGKIDDIRIFDMAISETEVQQLFNDGINLNQGLVAHYPFNGNANDASGNNRNGTNYGAALTSDRFGNVNSAYSFNGTSNYIDIPGTNNLNLNVGGLSLAAWINFTEQNNIHAIVGKHIAGYGNGYILQIRPATKGEFFIDSENGLQFSESLNDGQWHFLVGTFDGSTMKFYVDGMQKLSQNKTYTNTNDSTILIGKHHEGVAANFFNGKIDDIRIYNRPLTELEVTALFNQNMVGIKEVDGATPSSFYLNQNYPNPFNPSTTIRYQIPEDGMVTLKVYDILGREVKTLVNDFKTKGHYEVTFNADALVSGLYIYEITSGSYKASKKMTLIK